MPGGGGSQPPMMIVFRNAYTELPVEWNVRQLGERTNRKHVLYLPSTIINFNRTYNLFSTLMDMQYMSNNFMSASM